MFDMTIDDYVLIMTIDVWHIATHLIKTMNR